MQPPPPAQPPAPSVSPSQPQMLPLTRPLSAAQQPLVIITSSSVPAVDLAPSPPPQNSADTAAADAADPSAAQHQRTAAAVSTAAQPGAFQPGQSSGMEAGAVEEGGEAEVDRCPSPLPVNLEELDEPGEDLEGMMSGDLPWAATPPSPEEDAPPVAGIANAPLAQEEARVQQPDVSDAAGAEPKFVTGDTGARREGLDSEHAAD